MLGFFLCVTKFEGSFPCHSTKLQELSIFEQVTGLEHSPVPQNQQPRYSMSTRALSTQKIPFLIHTIK